MSSQLKVADIDFDAFYREFHQLGQYRFKPAKASGTSFCIGVLRLRQFACDDGQRTVVEKFVHACAEHIRELNRGGGQTTHYAVIRSFSTLDRLFRNNSVMAQHFACRGPISAAACRYSRQGYHRVCQVHVPSAYVHDPTRETSFELNSAIPVRGLVEPHAAHGTFADANDYENYVALLANGRVPEARAYAAGLAAGAHAYAPRDPFPFGHCKLLLFRREAWHRIFKRGEDVLTREDLIKYKADLDLTKVVVYTVNAATAQGHLSMYRSPHDALAAMPGTQSVMVDVKQLVDMLTVAFEDGVCDFDELTALYFEVTPANRK